VDASIDVKPLQQQNMLVAISLELTVTYLGNVLHEGQGWPVQQTNKILMQ
jgi:hypothetical protein